jgi:hypothetical protein
MFFSDSMKRTTYVISVHLLLESNSPRKAEIDTPHRHHHLDLGITLLHPARTNTSLAIRVTRQTTRQGTALTNVRLDGSLVIFESDLKMVTLDLDPNVLHQELLSSLRLAGTTLEEVRHADVPNQ